MTENDPSAPNNPHDMRPLVGAPVSNRSVWIFGVGLAGAAALMFGAMQNHRATISEPTLGTSDRSAGGMMSAPVNLPIPPDYPVDYPQFSSKLTSRLPIQNAPTTPSPPRRVATHQPSYTPPSDPDGIAFNRSQPAAPIAQVVFDDGQTRRPAGNFDGDPGKHDDRVRASHFANPSTTIPKGMVIHGVMETAMDSTRAGFARAIISRDVFSLDGSRVLIPKGSRLIGEYKVDLAPGQNRALIQWQRLMRPDNVVINLESPAADPLGRAGIKGKVNSHFLARFGGSILQSTLSIGTQVAINQLSDGTFVYAIPLATQAIPTPSPEKIQPTLTVKQGTSVSVFVAKDLDFSTVEP
ncbi:MAG: hypothetical protein RLY97_306 [Pseudomonadota bacterium]|jgi:type IV secretion system protein VirB10